MGKRAVPLGLRETRPPGAVHAQARAETRAANVSRPRPTGSTSLATLRKKQAADYWSASGFGGQLCPGPPAVPVVNSVWKNGFVNRSGFLAVFHPVTHSFETFRRLYL